MEGAISGVGNPRPGESMWASEATSTSEQGDPTDAGEGMKVCPPSEYAPGCGPFVKCTGIGILPHTRREQACRRVSRPVLTLDEPQAGGSRVGLCRTHRLVLALIALSDTRWGRC